MGTNKKKKSKKKTKPSAFPQEKGHLQIGILEANRTNQNTTLHTRFLIHYSNASSPTMYADLDDSDFDYGETDEDEIDRDQTAHIARYLFCCVYF